MHRLDDAIDDLPADHQEGQLLDVRVGGFALGDDFALAHDVHAVGDGHDFLQFVRNDDDALARRGQLAHRLQQRVDLQRRQHGRRLVEDDDLRVLIEDLEDFDALAQANRAFGDARGRVDLQLVFIGKGPDGLHRLVHVHERAAMDLIFENDVFRNGHFLKQHEVLLNHADACGHGVRRRAKAHLLAVDVDLAGIRPDEAVEDLHNGGFAGAILADDGQDFAPVEVEADVVVRADGSIRLDDVFHFKDHDEAPRS